MPFLDVPILFLMFNRPDHAGQVLKCIKEVQPSKLYVAVDGARHNHPDDLNNVQKCLALLDQIDWPCELNTLIREENIGCGRAVSTAINWFFENEEMGIILEDDCLPDQSFFAYCQELLMKYQHNNSIMHIGGSNYQDGHQRGFGSYYFTKICHVWGWATWRRAWSLYDFSMASFPQFTQENTIQNLFESLDDQMYWLDAFQRVREGKIDTWDYQWVYAVWTNNAMGISPNVNLIKNIGFDASATHTKKLDLIVSNHHTEKIREIIHPTFIIEDKVATDFSIKTMFKKQKGWRKKLNRVKLRLQHRTWYI